MLLASALGTRAVVPSVDGLPRLNDETFELETQSSTGQTTGTWVVLFERGESARSARARRALTEAREELLASGAVAASIDAEESPETFDRFRLVVKTTPSVVVLRSGRAYAREVTSEDDGRRWNGSRGRRTPRRGGTRHSTAVDVHTEEIRARDDWDSGFDRSIVRADGCVGTHAHEGLPGGVSRVESRRYKAARDILGRAMKTSSSEYGLLFMLIGAVFIVTAGVLAVVTFPTNSLNQAKMKTE